MAENIYTVKANAIGYVEPKGEDGKINPQGKLPIYFLGALFSVTLDQQTREVVGQVALGLNPSKQDAGGGMTFVVPAPLAVAGYTIAGDAPNLLLTLHQDLNAFIDTSNHPAIAYPTLDLQFGRVVTVEKKGALARFQLDPGTLCEFIYITPALLGVENPIGLKNLQLNLRELHLKVSSNEIITSAQVGGPVPYVGGCFFGVNSVNQQFKDKGNTQYAQQIKSFSNALLNLLSMDQDQLLSAIKSAREASGITGE